MQLKEVIKEIPEGVLKEVCEGKLFKQELKEVLRGVLGDGKDSRKYPKKQIWESARKEHRGECLWSPVGTPASSNKEIGIHSADNTPCLS